MSPIRNLTTAALFIALTAISAFIAAPVGPVPVTFQSCVVLIAGAVSGSRSGATSQMVYVFTGLLGLPVFAGGRGGPGMVISPTFGYLIGFIAAAYVTGWIREQSPRPSRWRTLSALISGQIALTLMGALYLYFYFNVIMLQAAGWGAVLAMGVLPFLAGDVLKVALAASVVMALDRLGIGRTDDWNRRAERYSNRP